MDNFWNICSKTSSFKIYFCLIIVLNVNNYSFATQFIIMHKMHHFICVSSYIICSCSKIASKKMYPNDKNLKKILPIYGPDCNYNFLDKCQGKWYHSWGTWTFARPRRGWGRSENRLTRNDLPLRIIQGLKIENVINSKSFVKNSGRFLVLSALTTKNIAF